MTASYEEPASGEEILRAAREAFAAGDVLTAVDTLQRLPEDQASLASRQLLAGTLLRAGALNQARDITRELLSEGHADEETLGLVAREAKARWQSGDAAALKEAQAAYQSAFDRTGGTWTGVNAATLALIAGDAAKAKSLAAQVETKLAAVTGDAAKSFWHLATCGEIALLLGRVEEAMQRYQSARALAPNAWGDLHSARRNAEAILAAQGKPASTLDSAFPVARVAVFSGHTVDRPGRESPRFPAGDEAAVRAAIADVLTRHDVAVGVSAAACGGDILFLEALQKLGRDTFIVLPHSVEVFRKVSVTDIGGEAWGKRFDAVIAAAREVVQLADHAGEDLSYQFQGAVMAGIARLKARALGGEALGIVYWDGEAGGVGGTSMVVEEWAERGMAVEVLPYRGRAGRVLDAAAASALLRGADLRAAGGQRVVSILFADAVGFSKLGEFQVKSFVQEFWGRVATLLDGVPSGALRTANTWGDGLFLVFSDSIVAAHLATELAHMVTHTDWVALGLAPHTNIRVALHAGPAYEIMDPVTRRAGFAGMHISRAARIEPVTPPGQVYVSEAFAALLTLDDSSADFACEYVGTVPLAKNYGRFRTYRLTRPGKG